MGGDVEIAIFAALCVFVGAACFAMYWSGRWEDGYDKIWLGRPTFGPYGKDAFNASAPIIEISGIFLGLSGFVTLAPRGSAMRVVLAVSVACMFICCAIGVFVFLTMRPRFFVPPYLRGRKGYIAAKRAEKGNGGGDGENVGKRVGKE